MLRNKKRWEQLPENKKSRVSILKSKFEDVRASENSTLDIVQPGDMVGKRATFSENSSNPNITYVMKAELSYKASPGKRKRSKMINLFS